MLKRKIKSLWVIKGPWPPNVTPNGGVQATKQDPAATGSKDDPSVTSCTLTLAVQDGLGLEVELGRIRFG